MSSDDEKYLDSLLNSARSKNKDPHSALSRMSSKGVNWSDSGSGETAPGDIGALVDNANGNEDLAEIGEALNRLDKNEFLDEDMAALLDDIEKPTNPSIPQFSVGSNPSIYDTRDPEEKALDEVNYLSRRMSQIKETYFYKEVNKANLGMDLETMINVVDVVFVIKLVHLELLNISFLNLF